MTTGESPIEMVRRHVRQGERQVAEQRALLADLQRRGRPTEMAEQLLANFESIQAEHMAHLARLEARPS